MKRTATSDDHGFSNNLDADCENKDVEESDNCQTGDFRKEGECPERFEELDDEDDCEETDFEEQWEDCEEKDSAPSETLELGFTYQTGHVIASNTASSNLTSVKPGPYQSTITVTMTRVSEVTISITEIVTTTVFIYITPTQDLNDWSSTSTPSTEGYAVPISQHRLLKKQIFGPLSMTLSKKRKALKGPQLLK